MITYNETLTIEEATALFNFRGTAMWPDTKHNREMMASLIAEKLKKFHGK